MTKEFATRYAAALLKGAGMREQFEIAFPEQLDTAMVAEALEELGCQIEWARFRHFATVHAPQNAVIMIDPRLLRRSAG